ncbi:MAG: leucyl aminopeptidase family protein [Gammaproteobacteria bacterium]
MKSYFTQENTIAPIDVYPIKKADFATWLTDQTEHDKNWLTTMGFSADSNKACLLPNQQGKLAKVIYVAEHFDGLWQLAGLPAQLPAGIYQLHGLSTAQYELAACGWGLAVYKFTLYKTQKNGQQAILFLPKEINATAIESQIDATNLVRDLVNIPAENMGPAELAMTAEMLATSFEADIKYIIGDELLEKNFPAIHAVGRGSKKAPQLIDMIWGDATHPKVTIVGKGVCFDSGGYDIKTASGMRLMKKDMGGAAQALGLAQWIMASKLPIRLRVIIGAVENMISGNAYRPGDIIPTRKGLNVEIGNTDAEGRVVLSDCLALASEDKPEIIIDFATLTGAGKIGLGPDVPSLFSNNNELAQQIESISMQCDDLVWHMPLHKPYREYIDSSFADLSNDSSSPYAGAITAALFLNEFVDATIPWLHFDIMAWNMKSRAGRPEGGDAMGMRAVYYYLRNKWKPL